MMYLNLKFPVIFNFTSTQAHPGFLKVGRKREGVVVDNGGPGHQ
jgi:hypothetical protein